MLGPYTCFSSVSPDGTEQRELESYNILNGNLFNNVDKIADAALFGQDYTCLARLSSDLLMLIMFFKIIHKERLFDISQGNLYVWGYYVEKYCLEKVKDSFYCRGVIIDELEALWSYWEMNRLTEDGIGHMQLEGDGTIRPIFRIRET